MERLVQEPQVALPGVPKIGEVIAEKYRVEGILGVGGMGVVLGARHLQLGQLMAIKVLSVSGNQQGDAIERFLREGRAAAALSSDHVVRIYDVGLLPTGIPFMVMERLRGKDLAATLSERGPLSIADAVEYVVQATMAIVEAHEVGIVHRDLKPSNLFLTQRSDGTACVKVLDFGISKQLTDLDTETMRGGLTSTRQVMGSPIYMSPEQVRDAKTVDHRTDIWALGVTLYELLTQQVAFDADTLPAVCAAIAADPPVPVRTRRPDVPEALESIVLRCLEKTPANRYLSARALLAALRAFQGKSVECEARSEGNAPKTEFSASLEPTMLPDQEAGSDLFESGPRSVNAATPEPADGTLVSGRTPISAGAWDPGAQGQGADTSPVASVASNAALGSGSASITLDAGTASPRRLLATSLAGLVLIGAATAWILSSRSSENRDAVSQQVEQQTAEIKPRFALRIESDPSQALVLEAGNSLGVTPMSIEIDRTVVRQSERRFVVHKDGFIDVSIRQGDSLTDVQQKVSLARGPAGTESQPATVDVPPMRRTEKPAAKPPSPSASPTPSSPAPDIRITR